MAPRTIDDYLRQLHDAMRGDDPALVQDALYDAEEYLRAELAQYPHRDPAEVLADIVASYGAPDEVAAAYRETERTVSNALRTPSRAATPSTLATVFGVFVDPRAYAAMFYMLLSLATGILYFTIAVTGLSLSVGLAITIVGIPFFLLFLALVRVLSLVEGRVVETTLGIRMPRRPQYPRRDAGLFSRIGDMLTDARTWTTLLYMVIQLPLGILYFTFVVTGVAVSVGLLLGPLGVSLGAEAFGWVPGGLLAWFAAPFGVLGLLIVLHVCRLAGYVHGGIAKYLLVRG